MPWEARDKPGLRRGIPKWYQWAHKTAAVNQVGCIYTAQGFEFDYIGVIIADDLLPDTNEDRLVGNIEASCDRTLRIRSELFDQHVKNIYRVLLTRGMQGCYVYFTNKDTEAFFRDRIAFDATASVEAPEITKLIPFENALPLLDLRAVADAGYESLDGYFAEDDICEIVTVEGGPFPPDRFLVRAEGDSMEPRIPDGSLCLFQKDSGGSRKGKIVLCRMASFAGSAPLTVIKHYQSRRAETPDSIGEAQEIVLSSLNPEHEPIELTEGQEFSILGVFERVIP